MFSSLSALPYKAILIAIGVFAVFWFAFNLIRPVNSQRVITVVGEGRKTVQTEKASVAFSVVVQSGDRATALSQGNETFSTVLKGTERYQPEEVNKTAFQITELAAASGTLYQYSNAANLTLKDPTQMSALVSQLYTDGASHVTNVTYIPANKDVLEKEVRELAVTDAKRRAQEMAKAAGASVGKVISIVEESRAGETGSSVTKTSDSQVAADVNAVGGIELGSVVTVTFELR